MNAVTDPNLQQAAARLSLVELHKSGASLNDISNEVYHADRSCVSVSGLKQLLRSPAHFHAYLNSHREETAAQFIGTAIHARILEPELFTHRYVAALASDRRAWKAFADFEAVAAAEGRRVMTRTQSVAIETIHANAMRHASARALILGGVPERTLIWQDEETGIWLKIRPDCLNFDFADGICLDVKSTDDASPHGFVRQCVPNDYDLQAAVYLEGLRNVFHRNFDFAFLAIEVGAPHGVALYGAPEDMLRRGQRRFRQALRLLAECRATATWPSYQSDGGYEILDWPRYAQ